MAEFSNVNSVPADGRAAMLTIKDTVKLAGATVPRSGTGAAFSSSADLLTAASDFGTRSWFCLRGPGGREWCFQKTLSTHQTWRVKVSPSAGFVGGSPSATQVPSATDEQVLWGSGTDASPTGATLFNSDGFYRLHVVAESALVSGVGLWHAYCTTTGSTNILTYLGQDTCAPNTYDPADSDPAIYHCATSSATAGKAFVNGVFATLNAVTSLTGLGALSATPPSSLDVAVAHPYQTAAHWKGMSFWRLIKGSNRVWPNTINKATSCYAYTDSNFLFKFANATDPVL